VAQVTSQELHIPLQLATVLNLGLYTQDSIASAMVLLNYAFTNKANKNSIGMKQEKFVIGKDGMYCLVKQQISN
jgi:hypothetical protein